MKLVKLLRYVIALFFCAFACNAYAVHCTSTTGTYTYPFQVTLTSTTNTVGYTTAWQSLSSSSSYSIAGDCTNRATYYTGTPTSSLTLASTDSDGTTWYNLADNDYLQVASQIGVYNKTTGATVYKNVPFTDVSNNCNSSCSTSAKAVSGSQAKVKLKIKTRFIGGSYIVNEPIAYLYANQGGTGLGTGTPIVEINLYASLTIPQTCTLNAGSTIEFNFGSINAQDFKDAGAGQKPSSASVMTKNVAISCNNIAAQTTLTLRLEASNVSGNAVISNNADVGFVLANSSGSALTPNDTTSTIPFTLDSNITSNVTLESWPVSITGNYPSAGTASATGYLRADFQ